MKMADGDLASIISGTDPTDPAQLQALQGQNIASVAANPLYWQNQGIFGGLARQMALSQGMDMARSGVGATTAANLAAQPDLAAAMASPNPMGYPAANPNMDPVARARLIAAYGGPGARLQGGETLQATGAGELSTAEAVRQRLQNLARISAMEANGLPGSGGATGGATPTGGTAALASVPPAGGRAPLPPGNVSPYGAGHYPAPPASSSPDQTAAPTPTAVPGLPAGPIPPPGPQRMQWLAQLTPAQRAAILSRLPQTPGSAPAGP
jgi:hypothetical protein